MFTIIIPTHNHQDTIKFAIQSAQQQSYQEFEIFVVGDGAPPQTRNIVYGLAQTDSRIRYFDNPKGEGHGEIHRAHALSQANGEFIAYLGDDDLWLPNHLQTLLAHLTEYDFVHSAQATVGENDNWRVFAGDLNHPSTRERMLQNRFNFFGPTTVAHRLDTYLSLPYGWRVKPQNIWSDLHMWRQWLNHRDVKFKSIPKVTILHLDSPSRLEMSTNERCEEMQYWLAEMNHNVDDFYAFVDDKLRQSWLQQIILGYEKALPPKRPSFVNSVKKKLGFV